MKKFMIALAFASFGAVTVNAQSQIEAPSKYTVATNSFWSNWFIQVGVDMTLQNPYGTSEWIDNVFPNGKSFGVDVAVGKWFTPGLGLRLKANWENGIIGSDHANWFGFTSKSAGYDGEMSATGAVGVNKQQEKGGYAALSGDVMFNLSNLLCGYSETRVWNFIPFVGAGLNVVFANHGNSQPVLRAGIENTWKISKLINIYLDGAYNWTTNAFNGGYTNGSIDASQGYVSIDAGVQFNLGTSTFQKAVTIDQYNALAASSEEALAKLRADLDRERQINADLRAQLAKKPAATKAPETVISSAANSVFFDINSSKLNSQKDRINLESIATAAKNSNAKVVVTGSADSKTGSEAYNQQLSEARAQAVADALVELGVNRDNIEVKSVGGVNDVEPYNLNRRAVIELK